MVLRNRRIQIINQNTPELKSEDTNEDVNIRPTGSFHEIKNVGNELYLDMTSGGNVVLHKYNGDKTQKWQYDSETQYFFNAATGKAMYSIRASTRHPSSSRNVLVDKPRSSNRWKWVIEGSRIKNVGTGLYLDFDFDSLNVKVMEDVNSKWQQWEVKQSYIHIDGDKTINKHNYVFKNGNLVSIDNTKLDDDHLFVHDSDNKIYYRDNNKVIDFVGSSLEKTLEASISDDRHPDKPIPPAPRPEPITPSQPVDPIDAPDLNVESSEERRAGLTKAASSNENVNYIEDVMKRPMSMLNNYKFIIGGISIGFIAWAVLSSRTNRSEELKEEGRAERLQLQRLRNRMETLKEENEVEEQQVQNRINMLEQRVENTEEDINEENSPQE